MCLILFSYRADTRFDLVLAANRDEFYRRPSAPADFWRDPPSILGGRDLEAGGTWLGVTPERRFAAVTNYRETGAGPGEARSRGELVVEFLMGGAPPEKYAATLAKRGHLYRGFSLIFGDPGALWHYSNRGGEPRPVPAGMHGLSNHLLDTPWPKVERGKRRMAAALKDGAADEPRLLLDMLHDRTPADDASLPDTGVGIDRERVLSPLFIRTADYGTRCSTVLLIPSARSGAAMPLRLLERSFDRDGETTTREFAFEASGPAPARAVPGGDA